MEIRLECIFPRPPQRAVTLCHTAKVSAPSPLPSVTRLPDALNLLRAVMQLILEFLDDHGYSRTLEKLEKDTLIHRKLRDAWSIENPPFSSIC